MRIRFFCQNGHLLKAAEQHAGRNTTCPKCHISVTVPRPVTHSSLTDSQAVRLLGTHSPSQRTVATTPSLGNRIRGTDRNCPKCRNAVTQDCRICPYCNIYLGALE